MNNFPSNFPDQEGKIFVFRHYGLAPSVVFRDPDLSMGAKALYGYLSTFVNASQMKAGVYKAWPSRRRILNELGISVNTLSKYLAELKAAQLLCVNQSRTTIQDGKQVFGNNEYVFQLYLTSSAVKAAEDPLLESSVSNLDQLVDCDIEELAPSNTQGFNNTKNNPSNLSTKSQIKEPELPLMPVDSLIEWWNTQAITPHPRLGPNTRLRIEKALFVALEDYTWDQIIESVETYSRLYKKRYCRHKYRLVEFMEKKAYEHFFEEKNWQRTGPPEKILREDFTFDIRPQDRSLFAFLNDSEDTEEQVIKEELVV